MRASSATSTQMSAPVNLASTTASASTRSTPSTASALKVRKCESLWGQWSESKRLLEPPSLFVSFFGPTMGHGKERL